MLKKATDTERQADADRRSENDDPLFCARCRHLATRERWAISCSGNHLHTVSNPAGRAFRIRCFERAPGVAGTGNPTDDFTWFPGFLWRIALCRGCGDHLGWSYQGEGGPSDFHGLIADKLTTAPN